MSDEKILVRRQFERMSFSNAVYLILPDGRSLAGTATDMGFGGVFLILDEPLAGLQVGDAVALKLELYGRPSEFPATVAHFRDKGIGLKIRRSSDPLGLVG